MIIKFTIVTLLATMSPGPDFALIMRNSLRESKKSGFITLFGVIVADCFHMSYCYLGLKFIITSVPKFFEIIQYLGSFYLMYLGLSGVFAKKNFFITKNTPSKQQSKGYKNFMQGFFLSALNPKSIIFFVNLFSVFFSEKLIFKDFIIYTLIVIAVNLFWFSILISLIHLKKVANYLNKHGVILERIIGFFLFFLGLKLFLDDELKL